ncbi:NUDIX hydrolase [Thalassococcus sp. BH17M4-6]|uniref:NUDIX hydrolase n=1 Tax=Thalassococcus sp. BH17M4-6 TaxID=3413148 RepID=UPI003BCB216F
MPLSLRRAQKTDVRTQFAALCYRITNDKPQILLITSLSAKRWIVPKGWPEHGLTPAQSAAREAWEEAGVRGDVAQQAIGLFSYVKVGDAQRLPCVALVFPLQVRKLSDKFPERNLRQRAWFSRNKAAAAVREPELAQLLRQFDPRLLRR